MASSRGRGVRSHLVFRPREFGSDRELAWDAPTLLAAMAGVTSRIRSAVHVLNASLRPPLLLAGQLAVAQASSGGRLEVGLGTGSWHLARHDHRAAGVPFPPFAERVTRLEATCRSFRALWRGETVTDDVIGLEEASLGPIGIDPPPIVVVGTSDRGLAVAAASLASTRAAEKRPSPYRSTMLLARPSSWSAKTMCS